MPVAAGGSATIYGVLCQMLWTLLNAFQIRIVESDADPVKVTATRAFLIVEPVGGGGDLVHVGPGGRRVQQVKTRSSASRAVRSPMFTSPEQPGLHTGDLR